MDEEVYYSVISKLFILTNDHDCKPNIEHLTTTIQQLAERFSDLKMKSIKLLTSFTTYKLENGKFISPFDSTDVAADFNDKYELFLRLQVSKDEVQKLEGLISIICKRLNFKYYDFMCQFNDEFDSFYIKPNPAGCFSLGVKQFDFGNMINVNRFVSNKEYFLLPEKKKSYSIQNASCYFNPSAKMLNLNFRLAFCEDSSRRPTFQTFRMAFTYESITKINVCFTSEVEIYFSIKYAPKVYTVVAADFKTKSQLAETRWTSMKPINIDNLGRCKVYRMHVEQESFQIVYGLLKEIVKPILFTSIHVHSVEVDHFEDNQTLPFSINYALHCLLQQTTAFHDEIFIRDKTDEVFNQIIRSESICGREGIVLETLYRLYYHYLNHQVDDGYKKFIEFYKKVDLELEKEKADPEVLVRKIIWTPTHIRYCPPCKVKMESLLGDIEPEDLIQISMMDEDGSEVNDDGIGLTKFTEDCYLQIMKNKYNRFDFLKTLIEQRIPLNGLKICNRSYMYIGASKWPTVAEILANDVLLKAQRPIINARV